MNEGNCKRRTREKKNIDLDSEKGENVWNEYMHKQTGKHFSIIMYIKSEYNIEGTILHFSRLLWSGK